ncbi:peptidase C65 Otubain-domain-containing protein [Lasiosphaeria ovina]|uniref:ubiquitinyl hydrolase 1 n=1 Tax=Lasiosphaeria ovina TaxID=92902 RepID=A0AAE0TXW2_9PEZI|nr:peptidase C65 Otubain-domain-containing protein [Lasiosphaeria ovina]
MFQPGPTAYVHVSNGYGVVHGLPEYTFEETPLGLSSGGGLFGGGPGGSGAGSALIYTSPIFSASNVGGGPASSTFHFHTNSNNSNSTSPASNSASPITNHQPSPAPHFSMVKMEVNSDDLAAQEAAAREYQPQLNGPLIGNKMPSTAITEEYAKADPIYVQKTMALPQTYSHYRPVQGDGNCGWRAIGFGYFETLIKSGNKALIESEKQRLETLNDFIETVGGLSAFVFQDMADETIELLQKIAGAIGNREKAMAELTEAFNNGDISNSIMYHFRLLASSWLKGNREAFAAFITSDMGIDGYCQAVIERHNVEIEHLGIMLLVNVLLKPAGFVLEIAYLDRSVASEVNTYRFPDEANDQHPSALGPIIHLLYRPDHYDILYPVDMDRQVHRVTGFSQSYEIANTPAALHTFTAVDLQPLSMIPGFSQPPPGLAPIMDTAAGSPLAAFTPSPASSWIPSPLPFPEPVPGIAPTTPQQDHPVRFNKYCQLPEYVANGMWREPTFLTTTFKNSHFNVAHYNNPNFQPEEYKPEAD